MFQCIAATNLFKVADKRHGYGLSPIMQSSSFTCDFIIGIR